MLWSLHFCSPFLFTPTYYFFLIVPSHASTRSSFVMSNPYQIPPSAFQDDPTSNLSGYNLRGSSYASVASGPGNFARSGASFAQLLNPTSNGADGTAADGGNSSTSNLRPPYTSDADVLRGVGSSSSFDAPGSALYQLLGARNTQLPSFSHAFEHLLQAPAYESHGAAVTPSNTGFFTPSYLRDSVYVQRLERQYKARMQALRESQLQSQHAQGRHVPNHHPHPPTTTLAVAAAAAGVIGGASVGGSGGGNVTTTTTTTTSSSHNNASASTSAKAGPSSYRGMSFDVVEKVPGAAAENEEDMAPLPSRWEKKDKPQSSLEVLSDGLDVKYTAPAPKGTGERDQDICSIRADYYMPPQCGIYYFEVTVLGKHKGESTIGIGFSDASVSLTRQPGWEPKSWGYHSDDGNTFYANSQGKAYGPPFGSGDVVGCGLNFRTGTAFYTKNGEYLGIAFQEIKGTNLKLFPTIGLKKTGEHVRVNFGQSPFTFDIDGMMKEERILINNQIDATSTDSLAPPLGETDLIQQLVLQFLQHDGYVETARAFAGEIQTEKQALNLDPSKVVQGISITDDEDANNRQRIRRAVLEGDIDQALKLTKFYYPRVLEKNEEVYFRLRCRKFVELVRKEAEMNLVSGGIGPVTRRNGKQSNGHGRTSSSQTQQDMDMDDIDMAEEDSTDTQPESQSLVDEAIVYGQALNSEYADDPRNEIRTALSDIFALMAYSNPLKEKEVAHMMDQRGRVAVAEELNSAILQSLGKSSRAALENLYAQTSVLLEELRQDGGPGAFVTIQGVIDQIPTSNTF